MSHDPVRLRALLDVLLDGGRDRAGDGARDGERDGTRSEARSGARREARSGARNGAKDDRATDGAALASLDDVARERLIAYVLLLAKWNRIWNLTAVRDPEAMLSRHLIDSLSLLPAIDAAPTTYRAPGDTAVDLLDIGSGAGLPVLPLAIARPTLCCVSVERTGKKARFQRQAVLELGLDRVDVREARIEAVRVTARIVTSRAFTAPTPFLEIAARHVAPGGQALLMLGRAERLPDALPAPFRLSRLEPLAGSVERHIVVCDAGS